MMAGAGRQKGHDSMIRERRDQDLGPLCDLLRSRQHPLPSGRDPLEWLTADHAEQSWVYDMAPVRVTPTRNVVGHVQMRALADDDAAGLLAEHAAAPLRGLMAVDKLFVRPDRFEFGIGRHLLKQAVGYIRGLGRLPVLDLDRNAFTAAGFYERFGFRRTGAGDPSGSWMVFTR